MVMRAGPEVMEHREADGRARHDALRLSRDSAYSVRRISPGVSMGTQDCGGGMDVSESGEKCNKVSKRRDILHLFDSYFQLMGTAMNCKQHNIRMPHLVLSVTGKERHLQVSEAYVNRLLKTSAQYFFFQGIQ